MLNLKLKFILILSKVHYAKLSNVSNFYTQKVVLLKYSMPMMKTTCNISRHNFVHNTVWKYIKTSGEVLWKSYKFFSICCLLFNSKHCIPLFNLTVHKYEVEINFKQCTKDIECKNPNILCVIFISGYIAINKTWV